MIKISKVSPEDLGLISRIGESLAFLRADYPNFREWYNNKVKREIPGENRSIFVAYPEVKEDFVGILILKKSEKKICTLCVLPDYQGRGIGTMLMQKAIDELGTDTPLITVSESHIGQFKGLLCKFKFKFKKKYFGYYKDGCSEFSYNGFIESEMSDKVANG